MQQGKRSSRGPAAKEAHAEQLFSAEVLVISDSEADSKNEAENNTEAAQANMHDQDLDNEKRSEKNDNPVADMFRSAFDGEVCRMLKDEALLILMPNI